MTLVLFLKGLAILIVFVAIALAIFPNTRD